MQVKDVMIPLHGSVQPDTTLRDAAEKMRALEIDPVPVVEDGRVVGAVSHEDLKEVAQREQLAAGSKIVGDVMSTGIVCCRADEEVGEAWRRVADEGSKNQPARMPVVDSEERLVGVVAVADLRDKLEGAPEPVTAVSGVEPVETLVTFDEDRVDFMSNESFPASDPLPPPSTLGPSDAEEHPEREHTH